MQKDLLEWLLVHYGHEQMRPGLERIKKALEGLLPSFEKTKIITIAGTNGKGETALHLSNLLKEQKHFVWTSPHVQRITERFRNEKGEITHEELGELFEKCHSQVISKKLELSFYEFLFFVFCTWAARTPSEFILLEVGLGGRLDAVNVLNANLVLLPSISRDHQEILGNRFDLILQEKLGVLRKNAFCIHFLDTSYLSEKAQLIANSVGAEIKALRDEVNIPNYEFSLRNSILAGAAFCQLMKKEFIPSDWVKSGIPLEYRGEFLENENRWSFFGSHNVDGLRKLIQFLHSGTYNFSRLPFDLIIVSFSRRIPQDLKLMMKMLKRAELGKIVVTTFDHPKAESAQTLEALSREEGLDFVRDIEKYIHSGITNQHILVAGSYYFLGYIKSVIGSR